MATKSTTKSESDFTTSGEYAPSSGDDEISPVKSKHPPQYPHNHESHSSSTVVPEPEQVKMSITHEVFFIGVVTLAHFMTQMAFAQALAPIKIIAMSFPDIKDMGQTTWSVAGYALTSGTFILISGRLGDMMGHRDVFVLGYVWFSVWSAFVGFSAYPQKQIFFDFCRAMQGIGPALLIPNGLALLARAYPPGMKKNLIFSLFGFMAPSGFVVGATFSSLFAELTWWPWAFWSFAIGCLILSIASFIVIPKPLIGKPTNPPGFDWAGSFTGVLSLVFINIAATNGPLYGWSTPHVYFTLIIGILFLFAFAFVEARASHPLLPIRSLNSTVGYVLACVALGWGCFGIWLFYTWRFLEQMRGYSPLQVAAQFAPAPISGLIASGLTGFMLTHTPVSLVNLFSMVAFCSGCLIAGTMPVKQSYWAQMFISIVVMPFGMDMSFPAATIVLSNTMPPEHQGLAASLVVTVVNYSISIALGIAGTVERSVLEKGHDNDHLVKGIKSGFLTGIVMAIGGIAIGTFFFARSLIKEGWKVL